MGLAKLIYDLIGTPVPQFLKRDGLSFEAIKGANGAMDINVKDATGGVNALAVNSDGSINTKINGSLTKVVTLVNAMAITDTQGRNFDLITHGGMTEAEIRQYNNFRVTLVNSHDQAASVTLSDGITALGPTLLSSASRLYTDSANLPPSTGRLILQDKAGGNGVGTSIKVIPSLNGLHSNLIVGFYFPIAPLSGSITVKIEMN